MMCRRQRSDSSTSTTVVVDNLIWFDKSGRRGQYSGTLNARHCVPDGIGEMTFSTEDQTHQNYSRPQRASVVLSYKGQWVNGDMSGFGVMTFASGEIYEGGFFDNYCHGLGVIKYPDGRVFDGIFQLGEILEKGRMLYADGSVYWGYFSKHASSTKNNQHSIKVRDTSACLRAVPNGRGKLTFADGTTVYDGEFSDGRLEGHGKLTLKDGSWYLGEFMDGKKNGIGLEVEADGTVSHEGVFCNGQKVVCSSIRRPIRCIGQLLLYRSSDLTGSGRTMLVGPMPRSIVQTHRQGRPM